MLGKREYITESYVESTRINDETGKVTKTGTYNTKVNYKTDKQMLGDWLGVGRYFIIFCLIMFFIAPVYGELKEKYTWEVTENGNTYTYVNPKDNVKDYKNLGNKMLNGFTEILETVGNISEYADTSLIENVSKPLSWFNDTYNKVKEGFNNVLEWFKGLF